MASARPDPWATARVYNRCVLLAPLCVVALWLVSPAASAESPRPAPTRSGVSWKEAQSLGHKLEAIDKRIQARPARRARADIVLVTEGELNSYLNLSLGSRMPAGVTDVDVRLDRDGIAAKAMVDLDQVRDRIPAQGPWNPINLLGGRVPVEVTGRLETENGFGTLQFDQVRLGPLSLPVSLLGQMVSSATQTPENPQGFDIQAPFRLPYSVKRIRFRPGRALLEL